MIGYGLDAIGFEHVGQLFGGFAIEGVDDPALGLHALDEPNDVLISLDGKRVTDYNSVFSAITSHKVGDSVAVTFSRVSRRSLAKDS